MASCLTVPSHYLNQCWLIINGVCGIHILKIMVASPKCQWINFQLPLLNYSHIRDMQLVWFLFITPVVFHKVSSLQHSGEKNPAVTICIQDTAKHTNLCSMCLLFVHKGRSGKSHICTSRISRQTNNDAWYIFPCLRNMILLFTKCIWIIWRIATKKTYYVLKITIRFWLNLQKWFYTLVLFGQKGYGNHPRLSTCFPICVSICFS